MQGRRASTRRPCPERGPSALDYPRRLPGERGVLLERDADSCAQAFDARFDRCDELARADGQEEHGFLPIELREVDANHAGATCAFNRNGVRFGDLSRALLVGGDHEDVAKRKSSARPSDCRPCRPSIKAGNSGAILGSTSRNASGSRITLRTAKMLPSELTQEASAEAVANTQ
jgi:hypothetical protein